jgi:ElaB/YqjD/DUF883 family membrane-anchored ribosome-binding protein
MIDQRDEINDLPDGTDTIIEGAANTGSIDTGPTGGNAGGGTVTNDETALATSGDSSGGSSSNARLADRIRDGRERLSNQAGERTRGLVTQGLERTAEALANVSKMVGDTAGGIEERLGPEYGDYARRAASAIESAANTVASKDPNELIDDTREFVRNSPGIALAGAAVVGFVLARLVKSGLGANQSADDDDDD